MNMFQDHQEQKSIKNQISKKKKCFEKSLDHTQEPILVRICLYSMYREIIWKNGGSTLFFSKIDFFPKKKVQNKSNMFLDTSNVNRNTYKPFKAHFNRFTDGFPLFQN